MSILPSREPECEHGDERAIELIVHGRPRDLGGFSVRRVLPAAARRAVGPFVFFDHMGPADLAPGRGIDVRPHPHIELATVTWLFEGALMHRDSLGSAQPIRPGAVNWMTAGRGIVHSERTPDDLRRAGSRVHGIQAWVALPDGAERAEPTFQHVAEADVPAAALPGARLRVLAGSAFGVTSPVRALSPLFYVDAALDAGAELAVPDEHEERAVFVADGALACDDERVEPGTMIVLRPRVRARVRAIDPSRLMLLGGAPLGPRHVWWNFVSASAERIEQAKRDWSERERARFPDVPGDEAEFIPLPDR